jgi:hypothetical protein
LLRRRNSQEGSCAAKLEGGFGGWIDFPKRPYPWKA